MSCAGTGTGAMSMHTHTHTHTSGIFSSYLYAELFVGLATMGLRVWTDGWVWVGGIQPAWLPAWLLPARGPASTNCSGEPACDTPRRACLPLTSRRVRGEGGEGESVHILPSGMWGERRACVTDTLRAACLFFFFLSKPPRADDFSGSCLGSAWGSECYI